MKKYKPKSQDLHLKGNKNVRQEIVFIVVRDDNFVILNKQVAYETDNSSKIQSSESVDEFEPDAMVAMEPAFSPGTIRMFEKVSHFLENYSFVLFLAIFFAFTVM